MLPGTSPVIGAPQSPIPNAGSTARESRNARSQGPQCTRPDYALWGRHVKLSPDDALHQCTVQRALQLAFEGINELDHDVEVECGRWRKLRVHIN